ncbi:hypothetical protein BGZ46_008204 [Entomortierella lignicola]|nr:hypothetical protein BGZ46_008204 [Entomortierella lignicola]
MKSTTFIAVASALASVVTADYIAFSTPNATTTWNLANGNSFPVSWTSGCSVTDSTVYDITLNIQLNGLWSLSASPLLKSGSTLVTVPNTVTSGNLYSILVDNDIPSYSALFFIFNPATITSAANTAFGDRPTSSSKPTSSSSTGASKPAPDTTKPSSGLIGGISAGVMVVVAIGLFTIFRIRKTRSMSSKVQRDENNSKDQIDGNQDGKMQVKGDPGLEVKGSGSLHINSQPQTFIQNEAQGLQQSYSQSVGETLSGVQGVQGEQY